MHDFRAKLSDPRVAPVLESYLKRARHRRGFPIDVPPAEAEAGPVSINLDLTLACDYRCAHCIDHELLNGGRILPLEIVLATLDVLKARGLRSVILIGGGEPTLYPYFEHVVARIKDLRLQCAIVSNGAHNERISAVAPLLGAGDWVRLSLDAGTDPTFQALHRPRRPVSLEHICRTAAGIKERAPQVQLGFSFIVMWKSAGQARTPVAANVHEIPAAAALAKAHRFDYISFKPMLVRGANRAEVVNLGSTGHNGTRRKARDLAAMVEIRDSLRAAETCADSTFRVVPSRNLLALLGRTSLDGSPLHPGECHMQHFRQVVTPVGIYGCPAHRGNGACRIADSAGYASADRFAETARAAQAHLLRFDAAAECREITCIYNEANWWMEELIRSGLPPRPQPATEFFL